MGLDEEAKKLLAAFQKTTIRHVPYEENKGADEMANRAIDERS